MLLFFSYRSARSTGITGFGRRIGGSVRVSARDPRLPPLIPPPVNIQIASPVDEDEDESNPKTDILDLFQQASIGGENERHSISYSAQPPNSVTNSPQRGRQQQPLGRRYSHSVSPKHNNCNPIKQQSIFNRMDQRFQMRGNNLEEGGQYHHNVLEQRKSSPVVGTRWQQGPDPYNSRPYHPEQPTIQTFDDQFDEFVYKSKHIAHCEPSSSAMVPPQVCWEDGGSESVTGKFDKSHKITNVFGVIYNGDLTDYT